MPFGAGSASGGGVDVSGESELAADQVADGARIADPGPGFVLAEDDMAHPVDGVLHRPVPAGPRSDLARVGLFGRQAGDGADGLAGPLLRPVQAVSALNALWWARRCSRS